MDEKQSFFNESKQLVLDYVEARIALLKITIFEKIATVTAVLFSSIIIALVAFFILLFLSISGGLYIGALLNNNSLGFLIIAGFYLLLFIVLIAFRKQLLEKKIADKVIEQLFKKEDSDE